jgi:hypothetical protein
MTLEQLKQGVMVLVFIAVLAAAGAIALDEFNDDLTADTYADNVTDEGLEGIGNATSYLSTIGTLLGVAALIAVVVGAFYFVTKR